MINEQDRESLIKYRIGQANDTIDLAKFLIDSNKLSVAVNRIYYGLFYAITALAIKHKFETSKHSQLLGWFNKDFIATGLIDKRFGKILRNSFKNRTKGDYDAFVTFEFIEVSIMHNEMVEFIQNIENLLKE
ncbi:MAG: HEPN domain-containing protein [Bacteroidales bacterium]|nr:HEPN domain-containing protein [Bacteroidales bacterium]